MSRFKRSTKRRSRYVVDGGLSDRFNPLALDEDINYPNHLDLDPLPPTVLNVPAGTYEIEGSRYPLLRLVVEVLKHRTWHWVRGEGFRD